MNFHYLAAEGASVGGVLSDFHLLDHLSQRGTITGTVFTSDADYLKLNTNVVCFSLFNQHSNSFFKSNKIIYTKFPLFLNTMAICSNRCIYLS